MKIRVTGDSTCDLSKELIERYDISIFPLKFQFMGARMWIMIFTQDMIARVKSTFT